MHIFIQTITCSRKHSTSMSSSSAVISVPQAVQLKDIGMQTPTVSPSGQSVGSANSSCASSGATELLSSPPDLAITNGYMRPVANVSWNNITLYYYFYIYLLSKHIYPKTSETKVAEVLVFPLQDLIVLSWLSQTVCTTSPMTILISNTIPVPLLRQPP